jgi:peptidoglycan hydrolase-like protein with peptidoglycan-binding domain
MTRSSLRRVAAAAVTLTVVGGLGLAAADSASAATVNNAAVAYTSSTTATVLPWPVVRQGAHGHPVRTLQRLLRARGFYLVVDGIFGPVTRSKVIAFQRSRGLAADGVVGPHTWSKLVITVRLGSTGEAVRALEEEIRFRDLRCGCYPIDGRFTTTEDRFVRAFQRAVGITVDGIVGPVTWRALVSGMLAG